MGLLGIRNAKTFSFTHDLESVLTGDITATAQSDFASRVRKNSNRARLVGVGSSWNRPESNAA